jgi:hypothetical protein
MAASTLGGEERAAPQHLRDGGGHHRSAANERLDVRGHLSAELSYCVPLAGEVVVGAQPCPIRDSQVPGADPDIVTAGGTASYRRPPNSYLLLFSLLFLLSFDWGVFWCGFHSLTCVSRARQRRLESTT